MEILDAKVSGDHGEQKNKEDRLDLILRSEQSHTAEGQRHLFHELAFIPGGERMPLIRVDGNDGQELGFGGNDGMAQDLGQFKRHRQLPYLWQMFYLTQVADSCGAYFYRTWCSYSFSFFLHREQRVITCANPATFDSVLFKTVSGCGPSFAFALAPCLMSFLFFSLCSQSCPRPVRYRSVPECQFQSALCLRTSRSHFLPDLPSSFIQHCECGLDL